MRKSVSRPRQETLTHDDLLPIFICRDNYLDEKINKSGMDLREMVKSNFLNRNQETRLC